MVEQVTSVVYEKDKIKANDIIEKQIEQLQEARDCTFEHEKWSAGYGSLVRQGDTDLYVLPASANSSLIRYNESVSSDLTTKFTFTPETEIINVIILFHDLFEVVVGDGDQYGLTFKANLGNRKMDLLSERIDLDGGIKIGADVSVKIVQIPLPRGDYEVVTSVTYTRPDGRENTEIRSDHFPIPSEFKETEKPIRVSIGVANTQGEIDILTRFKCFKPSAQDFTRDLSSLSKG